MRKILALMLSATMIFAIAACKSEVDETTASTTSSVAETSSSTETSKAEEVTEPTDSGVEETSIMSYEEYDAAAIDDEVTIMAYVQAKQSWWDNKATVYLQDYDGAYFCYEMACTEDEYELLTYGRPIVVNGYKAEWSGEIEIVDATFEIVEDEPDEIFLPLDVTEYLGTDDLIKYQNLFVKFEDMTVKSVAFKNDVPGDDIYVTFTKDGNDYSFCLEYYLNGDDEEFYNQISNLEEGEVVEVQGFLYWYNGANPHITAVIEEEL